MKYFDSLSLFRLDQDTGYKNFYCINNLTFFFTYILNFLGADPKSVLCAFFKQGQCKKGDKCKFSHDLNVSRKGEKRSMYTDTREEGRTTRVQILFHSFNEMKIFVYAYNLFLIVDNMENWDEKKLEEVVNKKHGESNKAKQTTTNIVSDFLSYK